MIEVKIEDKEVMRLLDKAARRADDMTPAMREVSAIMLDAVEENFKSEGRPRWPSLHRRTIKERKRKGHWPGRILQRTGRLASSIQQKYDSNSAIVGTNTKYAAIHQFGGKITRYAHSGWTRLRTDAQGNLIRQKDHARLAVFAKDSHKRVKVVRYTTGGSEIKIPARPFLSMQEGDLDQIKRVLEKFLTLSGGKGK